MIKYVAIVTGSSIVRAQSGVVGVAICYQVKGEIVGASIHACERRLHGELWITEASIRSVKKVLREVFGWFGKKWSDLNGTDVLVGCEVELVVDRVVFNGHAREKIRYINKPGGHIAGEAMPQDKMAAIDEAYSHLLED